MLLPRSSVQLLADWLLYTCVHIAAAQLRLHTNREKLTVLQIIVSLPKAGTAVLGEAQYRN